MRKEEKLIGLRPTGPDTRMALGRYVKKNNGERERRRGELQSCQKVRALETPIGKSGNRL